MDHADAEVAQLTGREPLGLDLGGAALHLLRLLDQRADDEGLAALAQLPADELVGAAALVLVDDPRLHRLAPGRQLVQGGGVEVAVGGQRERARDRRRGHVQDVRRQAFDALGVERLALLDPEAVLLVDHAEAEAGELDRRLDQGVGADDQAELAAGEAVQRFPAPGRRRGPGEQRERRRRFGQQPAQGDGVLLGQRLGRRHQHRLEAGFERPQHRVERHHGLARADLAHQQPLHRLAGVEVGVDLVEGLELVAGRLEGQRLDPAPDALPRLAQPRRRPRDAVRALARRQDRLVEEELLEAQPLARDLDFLARLREVHGLDRVGGPGKPAAYAQLRRQRLEHVPDRAHRLLHPLPQALRFQLLGPGMDRDQAFARHRR